MSRLRFLIVALALLGPAAAVVIGAKVLRNGAEHDQIHPMQHRVKTADGRYRILVWRSADADRKLKPLILYSPGWGGKVDARERLPAHLAEQGYIVVAFDDVARDSPAAGEAVDARLARTEAFAMGNPAEFARSTAIAQTRLELAVRKARGILDSLLNSPVAVPGIDPARIGYVGYSFGGATGAELALQDNRINAVVNLDGWLFGSSRKAPTAPYLLISIDDDFPPDNWKSSSKTGQQAMYVGALADQSIHGPLIGRPNFYWVRARHRGHDQLIGPTADEPGREAIDRQVTAFLKRALMGAADDPLQTEMDLLRSVTPADLLDAVHVSRRLG